MFSRCLEMQYLAKIEFFKFLVKMVCILSENGGFNVKYADF